MDGVIDFVQQLANSVVNAFVNVVELVWNDIVSPIAEEIFNLLGFHDETIVTSYVVAVSLYGDQGYVNPFKKIPLNVVLYNTEWYDEILNVFISGEHIRIKYYINKVEKLGYTPTSSMSAQTINKPELANIIGGASFENEPVTIVRATVDFPNVNEYAKGWLSANQGAAGSGYNFNTYTEELTLSTSPFTQYFLSQNNTFTYDIVSDSYDVAVDGDITQFGLVSEATNSLGTPITNRSDTLITNTAANLLAAPVNTENSITVMDTAANVLSSPVSTYDASSAGALNNPQVLIVDTGIDNVTATPAATYVNKIITNTAIDNSSANPISTEGRRTTVETATDSAAAVATTVELSQLGTTPYILQDLIPGLILPTKQYQVMYTVDSDTNVPKNRKWWFYSLEAPPYTYPLLYPDAPIFPSTVKQTVLPILPIKRNNVWLNDSPTDQETIDTKNMMKKYGLDLAELTTTFKDDPAGNGADLHSCFIMFGINIATAASQAEIDYLYNFFSDYVSINPDLNTTQYLALANDIEFVKLWVAGRVYHQVTKGNDQAYWSLSYKVDETRMLDLFALYLDADYTNYKDAWLLNNQTDYGKNWTFQPEPTIDDVIGGKLQTLLDHLQELRKNNQTSYTISQGNYNITVSYGGVSIQNVTGTVGDGTVGSVEKIIETVNYVLKLRKQINATQYTEVTVVDLTGFSYVNNGTTDVYMTAMDFTGTALANNVNNNLVIPITYGYMLDLGIVARKEMLYRSAYAIFFAVNVTHLAYYETAAFGRFFGFVLKVIAIVVLVVSFGSAKDVSTLLWAAAKYYGTKLLAEYVIQQILLANPDSKLAQVLSIGIAIYASAVAGGTDISALSSVDKALLAINSTSQVVTDYTQIKSNQLIQESTEFLENAKDRNERLQQAIDNLDSGNDALLDYIKKTVTMKFTEPSKFYDQHLTRNLVDTALDLDNFTDVEVLLKRNIDTITV